MCNVLLRETKNLVVGPEGQIPVLISAERHTPDAALARRSGDFRLSCGVAQSDAHSITDRSEWRKIANTELLTCAEILNNIGTLRTR